MGSWKVWACLIQVYQIRPLRNPSTARRVSWLQASVSVRIFLGRCYLIWGYIKVRAFRLSPRVVLYGLRGPPNLIPFWGGPGQTDHFAILGAPPLP